MKKRFTEFLICCSSNPYPTKVIIFPLSQMDDDISCYSDSPVKKKVSKNKICPTTRTRDSNDLVFPSNNNQFLQNTAIFVIPESNEECSMSRCSNQIEDYKKEDTLDELSLLKPRNRFSTASGSIDSLSHNSEAIQSILSSMKGIRHITERRIFHEASKANTKEKFWVNCKWFQKYLEYLTGNRPLSEINPINNVDLKTRIYEAQEGIDYVQLSQDAWEIIHGLYSGGPVIGFKERKLFFKEEEFHSKWIPKTLPLACENLLSSILLSLSANLNLLELLNDSIRSPKFRLTLVLTDVLTELQEFSMLSKTVDPNLMEELRLALKIDVKHLKDDPFELLLNIFSKIQLEYLQTTRNYTQQQSVHASDLISIPSIERQNSFQKENSNSAWNTYFNCFPTPVDSTFTGLFAKSVSCKICGFISVKYEPFIDISFKQKNHCLEELLSAYFQEKEIETMRPCDGCSEIECLIEKTRIARLPPTLILRSKDFSISPSMNIDLSQFLTDDISHSYSKLQLNSIISAKNTSLRRGIKVTRIS